MIKYILTILFFSIAILLNVSKALAIPPEEQIQHYIIDQQASALSLLSELVNINSGTSNQVGVHQVGTLLQQQFQQLGFSTRWVEEPKSMQRAGTLFAEHIVNHGKSILLIGHLDTVFPKESPFQHFYRHGNIATGPGVIDDKGGDVTILYALKALQHIHALDNVNIIVALTGDEEESGKPSSISRKPLFEVAKRSNIALDFEPASSLDTATIARRGVSHWDIVTQGLEVHSSQIFQPGIGYGAIFELARILNTIRGQFASEHYLTLNPGITLGGNLVNYNNLSRQGNAIGKDNVIAKTTIASGDFRYLTEAQKQSAEKKLYAIVAQHLPGTKAAIYFLDGIPPMPPTQQNLQLLKYYSNASEALHYGKVNPIDVQLRGAADISYIANVTPMNLSGIGPTGGGTHSINEYLDINSLPIVMSRAAVLIYHLSHKYEISPL